MMDRRGLLAVLAGGMFAPGAWPLATGAARAQGAADPQQYRRMALMGGEFAIQTSRLALERGIDPRVREFAQLEINEQTAFAASLGGSSVAWHPFALTQSGTSGSEPV